ncbi:MULTISPECIES: N(2)-fixation sustaining protein CowN [Marichromatium]|uniref:N(2)-fixation sustaining protein CowN n=1 Tax=Marichromatium gracile TaxID=1048 RepID=A0A4V6P4V1_MARGR|nr:MULTISPECIES: N(2)-fixation sustaining protein CowN [Marichromatium]MBO8086520.1 N(2)-fixation sustaining protein CowN [Marichromatium sp.]MBK1707519.1 hypothetical protein [Marichromatium gracile]RNE92006.1 N(2)-fixation sustaining protein CowN [Marichromatium sp. AB31]RNE94127.1 N(2)-fixation sustaining protein CowN [Marichromatium sp. AB32]TCW39870.1 hypothetical protein EDC29_101286 [Marichromatium gracile]
MSETTHTNDRYVSFVDIDCESRVDGCIERIRACIEHNTNPSPLHDYVATKLAETEARGQDGLYLIGSQVNVLRELFEHHHDDAGLHLLECIELECC